MCGAYGFSIKDAQEVYNRFAIVNTLENLQPHYNVRVGLPHPVVTAHSPNQISLMIWGLIPHWAKDESFKYKTFNARAETVAKLATYREPFRHKRCLIPATGFYEPDKVSNPKRKPPYDWYYFQLKDQYLFAFAGIYDVWTDPKTGKEIYSYSLITTTPNALVGKVHDRMPVILQKEDEETWLNPDISEPELLYPLLKQYPPDKMEGWRAPDAARNPRNDNPALIRIVETSQTGVL